MTIEAALLIAITIMLDVFGQLGFKLGLNGIPETTDGSAGIKFWASLFIQPWLLCGIAAYGIEFFLWLAVLSLIPLSVAFPLASLSYCGVMVVSRVFLKESISSRRWLGCGLISAGAALVCTGIGA